MKKWVLIISQNKEKLSEIQTECLNYGMVLCIVGSIVAAIKELSKSNEYVLILILLEDSDISAELKNIQNPQCLL